MSLVKIVDEVTAWAEQTICSQVMLKAPAGRMDDARYNLEYTEVRPSAWSMFVPTEKLAEPSAKPPIPCLCVEILKGREDILQQQGTVNVRFSLATYNPGTHGRDMFLPGKDAEGNLTFTRWEGEEANKHFTQTYDGWRDAWNFLDVALREVSSHSIIAGYEVIAANGIDYGPFIQEGALVEGYPFWFAWLSFDVAYGTPRNRKDITHIL